MIDFNISVIIGIIALCPGFPFWHPVAMGPGLLSP